jgi:hypothetical protein
MSGIRVNGVMLSLITMLVVGTACSKSESEEAEDEASSGAEEAGDAVDEAADDTGDAVEDAVD